MGLLDEAIKQHLELKRRRGADPGEVDRLEQEALGPVRRVQQEAPADATDQEAPAGTIYDEDEYEDEPYEDDELEPDYEPEGPEPEASSGRGYSAQEDVFEAEPEPDPLVRGGVVPPEPRADPRQPPEPRDLGLVDPEDHLGIETAEYDVEAEHAREAGRASDAPGAGETGGDQDSDEGDMLEETPEFFQDAPDHDRLWFEQRPPKDFDFDG